MSENIKAFVTTFGREIIAYVVEETDTEYKLENALFLDVQPGPNGLGLALSPLSILGLGELQKGVDLILAKVNVLYPHDVREELKQAFSQQVGRIAVVPAGVLNLDSVRNKK